MSKPLPDLGMAGLTQLRLAWAQEQPDWARQRLRIMFMLAKREMTGEQIAKAAGVSHTTVRNCLKAFLADGVAGLLRDPNLRVQTPKINESPKSRSMCANGKGNGYMRLPRSNSGKSSMDNILFLQPVVDGFSSVGKNHATYAAKGGSKLALLGKSPVAVRSPNSRMSGNLKQIYMEFPSGVRLFEF